MPEMRGKGQGWRSLRSHLFCRSAAFVVLLAGCAPSLQLGPDLAGYDLTESERVRQADWPKLIDVPTPPPAGSYTLAVPDPAEGQAALARLSTEAQAMKAEVVRLSAPVLTEEERQRLGTPLR